MSGALATALLLALALAPQQDRPRQAPPPDSVARLSVARGVAPETVTVGDRFRSYVRVSLPPGARLEPGAFAPSDSLQLTDSVLVILADSGGARGAVGVYPLTAWIAGEPLRLTVPLAVTLAGGERRAYRVELRLPVVRSVLPEDTSELRPRPAKGLLLATGGGFPWWWLLLLAAAAAAALLARRLLARAGAAPPVDPRAEALSRLDRIGDAGPATAAEPFYTAVTRVLRDYLARVQERWGEELTTTELLARVARSETVVDHAALAELLQHADPVKFGGVLPSALELSAFRGRVREWIVANPPADERREAA